MEDLTIIETNGIQFRNVSLAENSVTSYSNGVKQYLDFAKENDNGVNSDSLKGFLIEIKKVDKPATFNLKMQGIKEFLFATYKNNHKQLFGISELFKELKRDKVKIDKAVRKEDYLIQEQITELCEKLTPKLRFIVQALFGTGCRVSELLNIKLTDIKLNGKASINVVGKGNKERTVYLSLDLYGKIKGYFLGKVYLFESRTGKQLNRNNLHKEINRQCKKYGYEVHPHTFRHSYAMYLKDVKKLSADKIALALGHSDVSTTLKYYFHGVPTSDEMMVV